MLIHGTVHDWVRCVRAIAQHFHGTNDSTIPYDGAEISIQRYTQSIAHCNLNPVVRARARPFGSARTILAAHANIITACMSCSRAHTQETFRNGTAWCVTYNQCDNDGEVVFCTIEFGDHSWPGKGAARQKCRVMRCRF